MAANNLVERVAKMEQKVEYLERKILEELGERKEGQKAIQNAQEKFAADMADVKKWIAYATGFLVCLQIVLQIILKLAFK
jgi:hypothetical protein